MATEYLSGAWFGDITPQIFYKECGRGFLILPCIPSITRHLRMSKKHEIYLEKDA